MKLKQLSMLLIAAIVVIFTGCSKDEEKVLDPTIDLIAGGSGYYVADDSVSVGDSVRIIFQATKGKDGAKLKEYKVVATTSANSVALTQVASNQEETFKYTYRALIITAETITFTVTDKDGKTASKSIKIKIKGGASVTPPKSVNGTIVDKNSFDLEGNVSQSGTTAPSNASDFDLYFFYSTNTASNGNLVIGGKQNDTELTASYAATWAGSNNASIKSSTAAAYSTAMTADESELATYFTNASDLPQLTGSSLGINARVNNIAPDQVYAVRTSSGKYALVKIKTADATSVTFDFLIQH